MAARARALALEDRFAARGVARHRGRARVGRDRPQIRDDVFRVDLGDVVRRHPRVRNAVPDDANEILVRRGAAELTAAQIHAGHFVAVGAVAAGARREEKASAVLDVGGGIFVLGGQCDRNDQENQDGTERSHGPPSGPSLACRL